MSDSFNSLDSGEVISIQKDSQVLVGHRIFRVSELNDAISTHLKNSVDGWNEEKSNWFTTQGIDCEALRFGSNAWQKGRIRLCLEFCPDETTTSASQHQANSTTIATPVAPASTTSSPAVAAARVAPVAATATATPAPTPPALHTNPNLSVAAETPAVTTHSTPDPANVPVAGIAAVGAGAAVMAAAGAVAANSVTIPNVATVIPPSTAVAKTATPEIADVILEPEQKPIPTAKASEGPEEIAFDFDVNNDNLGTMVPNGMMELDLSDLDLDRTENDYLDFETGGLTDPTPELSSGHKAAKSENSGMLIDEVWNEMSQPNWPGIH
jgi:KGK domain